MAINLKEFINATKIKLTTKEIFKDTKAEQLIKYINDNDIDIYENDLYIKEESFLDLLHSIYSLDVFLKILDNTSNILSIDYHSKEMAMLYNMYDPQKIEYMPYDEFSILLDNEYLKYASKEWTENYLINYPRILYVYKDKIISRKNTKYEDEVDYVHPLYLNLEALKKAKEYHLLKEAINKISLFYKEENKKSS